ncbi:uncharacterized protein LOC142231014 [Haematobia irritans]|uniref:uncharacterized protein LOC142231014 n=1 Tax=Haematobia irritans TaxID=7368 RepID=UPI003F4F60E4
MNPTNNPSDPSSGHSGSSDSSNIKAAGTASPAYDRFLFDCEYLILFCTQFEQCDIGDQTDSVLEVKLEDLEKRWQQLQTSYQTIMLSPSSTDPKDIKANAKINFNASSEAYYTARSQILDILRISGGHTRQQARHSLIPEYVPQNRNPVPISSHDSNDSYIKVPPCDTEVFKGGYEEWPSFRDMFTAVYVNHPKLTPAQKLYHLRNKTRGPAGAIVKRYTLCNENFSLAWDALKSRYENKRVLVDNQLKILFNIPVASVENSESIQRIQSTVNDCLCTLRTLDVDVSGWDPILIYLISTKLPDETLSLWEQSLRSHRELPTWNQLDEFLINRFEVVERISSIRYTKQQHTNSSQISNKTDHTIKGSSQGSGKIQTYHSQEKLASTCILCETNHTLRVCPKFRQLTAQQRVDVVYKNKICSNCLSSSHLKTNCKSINTCIICHKSHHSLLHLRNNYNENKNRGPVNNESINESQNHQKPTKNVTNQLPLDEGPSSSRQINSSHIQANFASNNDMILLRTALVQIEHMGEFFTVRALIDPGSQRTFISQRIQNLLKLPTIKANFEISGIGGQIQKSDKLCQMVIVSKNRDIRFSVSAIVLPNVTKKLPTVSFEIPNPSELNDLELADPHFNKSSHIDLVLGNDSERFINIDGIKKNICGETSAYNTIFGWVLSGPMRTETILSFSVNVLESEGTALSDLLRKFWDQEEVPTSHLVSAADAFCEEFYKKTTTRISNGRYMVRLPFREEFSQSMYLGSSRFIAMAQYNHMEHNLSKNSELRTQYNEVLNEYIELDHAEETSSREIRSDGKFNSFYLPHHAVIRPEHKSTKVRIVFNASRKTKSGFSLNDVLHTGPTLQSDLTSIILNWRKYQYVFCGDIQKMYRQIILHPHDRPYQRILFRGSTDGPIKDYQLKTVTFGINCAPFLAIRTLLQLASDYEGKYPRVAEILRRETYVDDILSGGFSMEEALKAQAELIEVLTQAGFPLKKIIANDPELLSHIPSQDLYDSDFLRFHESSSTKTLGVKWNALSDSFTYSLKPFECNQLMTKRMVLSAIAQLFDPAGWIAPVIIRSKILMQQLWLEGIGWDDNLSPESQSTWERLVSDLSHVNSITIPRWLQYCPSDKLEIHGFSDASQAAYCACVYIRCQTQKFVVFSNLLVAKSKVAPLKPVCLPRLELNGAYLLAKLVKYVVSTLNFKFSAITLWTDSSIVLGWLSKPPWSWETYVANRTAQIHDLVPEGIWRHVPTHDNPADLGTRGCRPQDLVDNSLWFNGPNWLTRPHTAWPENNPLVAPEIGKRATVHTYHDAIEEPDILLRFSSYTRALRVISYMFRFYNNCLSRIKSGSRLSQPFLTQHEVKLVKFRLITLSQSKFYPVEYNNLLQSKLIENKSTLKCLNPFLDQENIMRVNGRLADSSLSYNERYPIILPGNSRLCFLYLSHLHQVLAHADCTLMCRMVQTEFYISRLKPRVKSIIHKCKTCIIFKQKSCSQIMAPLPPLRCTLSPPFHITGIDFAGPFELKSSTLRRSPIIKGYVSIFVCFATKAIHLEPCSELSSLAFEAAFTRFVGRRGLPQRVVSDNGRNFIGASRKMLKEFASFVKTTAHDISQKYSAHGFEWQFIPPHAPHMGGLWESAVKSFKHHFKRIAGAHRFTFEQFATILARIEGILNSRPISAISEDPSDLLALTPGHFLKGSPIMSFPETPAQNISLVNRWTKLKALHHQFAIRWKEDYLKTLHKRYKWKNSSPNLKIGDLVAVMDDMLPPNDWRLGRIVDTHRGSDDNIRVADVRIASGIITRPIVKLCYLPLLDQTPSDSST